MYKRQTPSANVRTSSLIKSQPSSGGLIINDIIDSESKKPRPCGVCHKTGKCWNCHGKGISTHASGIRAKCGACNGTGRCSACDGAGVIYP